MEGFKLTKTQLLQQELFRKFAENEIKPIAKEMDEENFIAPVFLGTESVHYYRIFRNGP